MKFEIKAKNIEKTMFFLRKFRDETKAEYEKSMGNIEGKVKLIPNVGAVPIPIYDCDCFVEKDHIIFWNTFQVPNIMKKMGFLNPFRKAMKEMENNLKGYLKANGVECEVKLIE